MPVVLVTNHKGGVGKTFVAVHLAACLAEDGSRVLLVDCDGQYDAYNFFARTKPQQPGEHCEVNNNLMLLANGERQTGSGLPSLRSLGFEEENYDYIVLDSDAALTDAVKNILQNPVRLVVVPVDRQSRSIENLDELFLTIGRLFGIDSRLELPPPDKRAESGKDAGAVRRKIRSVAQPIADHVLIVPLAADNAALSEKLKRYRVKTKVKIWKNMPSMPDETDLALAGGVLIWEVAGLSEAQAVDARAYFTELAAKVKLFFGF